MARGCKYIGGGEGSWGRVLGIGIYMAKKEICCGWREGRIEGVVRTKPPRKNILMKQQSEILGGESGSAVEILF